MSRHQSFSVLLLRLSLIHIFPVEAVRQWQQRNVTMHLDRIPEDPVSYTHLAKKDMESMLDDIDKLNELDTSNVEPMSHVFPVQNLSLIHISDTST